MSYFLGRKSCFFPEFLGSIWDRGNYDPDFLVQNRPSEEADSKTVLNFAVSYLEREINAKESQKRQTFA